MKTNNTAEKRFEFGENWSEYLKLLDDERILEAEKSLKEMLETENLEGKKFLDIGSGSGIFSLAARRLGADVVSFDVDKKSVSCTESLKSKYFKDDTKWKIGFGSALNEGFVRSLGQFDVVYSWGVLHHTGDMWSALEIASRAVSPSGKLFIAIYNDQGWKSKLWWYIKWIYNSLPSSLKGVYSGMIFAASNLVYFIRSTLRLDPLAPIRNWRNYKQRRGMNPWRDWVDWVGGFPFEVSSISNLESFFNSRGFILDKVKPTGSLGCNQLVFSRNVKDQ